MSDRTPIHASVVIVGGGVGGVTLAASLRAGGHHGRIVMVEEGGIPYDRPPLSKTYLSGSRRLEEIALQPQGWYDAQSVELRTSTTVTALTPRADHVVVALEEGTSLRADLVVLATGGSAALPPVPGLDHARTAGAVHVLRSSDDADALAKDLRAGARLLVVGAGLIGAEAAATARELGCEVVLLDPLEPPLAGAVGREVATWLHAQHTVHGVEVVTGTLQALQHDGTHIEAQLMGERDSRAFDGVLVGVGMKPRSDLAECAGLDVDRGIVVDGQQFTSHPRVLAIGDAARLRDHPRAEHWEAAQTDAKRAAAAILGTDPPPDTAPWWWSDRYDLHVEGVGQMYDPDAITSVVVRGVFGAASFAVLTVRDRRVVGAVGINDSTTVRAARRLIDRRIEVDPQLVADPGVDIRKLLRG